MPRPPSIIKRLKEIVRDILTDYIGGKPAERQGRPPSSKTATASLTQGGRVRSEKPTRDFDNFAFIQDVLANMPAAVAAVRQLAEDVTLDENGDARAWTLAVKLDPIEVELTDPQREQLHQFKKELQGIFDNYAMRTGIGYAAKNYVYKMITAGDCFAEQVISLSPETGLGRIERIRELPTWQMRVIWDEVGELIAYEQWQQTRERTPIRWVVPSQIIHWTYHPTDYIPYGESIFTHLRGRWEQFKLVELDLIVAVHTRSVNPEIHSLGSKDGLDRVPDEQIEAYKQQLRDNPTDINRFYVVRQGEVEIAFNQRAEGQAVTAMLETHRDLENRFVEALGVPGHISGNVKDVAGRHVSSSLDQKYARRINSIRQDFTHYLYASILLEFALHGINFNDPGRYGARRISLEVSWPDLGENRTQRSKRVTEEWSAGLISHEAALRQIGTQDVEGELACIKFERDRGDLPLSASTGMSPNDEQGKGVQTDGSQGQEEDDDPQEPKKRKPKPKP